MAPLDVTFFSFLFCSLSLSHLRLKTFLSSFWTWTIFFFSLVPATLSHANVYRVDKKRQGGRGEDSKNISNVTHHGISNRCVSASFYVRIQYTDRFLWNEMAKYVWWTTIYRKPFKTVGVDRFSWAINSRKLERRAQPWGPADISANCFDENLFFGCIIIFTRVHAQRATNGTKPNLVYHSMMVCNIGNFKRNPMLKKKIIIRFNYTLWEWLI